MNPKDLPGLPDDIAEKQKRTSSMERKPRAVMYCRFACDPDSLQKNRAWIYGSAGTIEQNGRRPPAQLEKLTAEAKRRGYTIVGTSYDAGVKGDPIHRPGIQLMLEAVQRGEVDIVILASGSQINRLAEGPIPVLKLLYENDVHFYIPGADRSETPPIRRKRKGGPER